MKKSFWDKNAGRYDRFMRKDHAAYEALYRLTLYTRPELAFRLGDRVEVTDEGGSVWMGRTSDSFRYDSHCVTVVEISGVEPSAGDAEGVCGGQVSRETGKEGQA